MIQTKKEQQEQLQELKKQVEKMNFDIAGMIQERGKIQKQIQELAVEIVTGGAFDGTL
jgi:chaperonin cofactor prefoldin